MIVAAAHCSVDFHPGWELSEDREAGSVSQPLGDSGGSVFLHYGPSSTVETYVGAWRERYGDGAHVTADGPVLTGDGLAGRGVTLALDEQVRSRRGAERAVTPPQTLVCHGFAIRSLPVLVGYLTPRSTDKRLLAEANRIVASLRVT